MLLLVHYRKSLKQKYSQQQRLPRSDETSRQSRLPLCRRPESSTTCIPKQARAVLSAGNRFQKDTARFPSEPCVLFTAREKVGQPAGGNPSASWFCVDGRHLCERFSQHRLGETGRTVRFVISSLYEASQEQRRYCAGTKKGHCHGLRLGAVQPPESPWQHHDKGELDHPSKRSGRGDSNVTLLVMDPTQVSGMHVFVLFLFLWSLASQVPMPKNVPKAGRHFWSCDETASARRQ